jgi:hypothetical protein
MNRNELSARELTALKEIALSGQASDHLLARRFLDENIVVDLGEDLLLTNRGRSLLLRGSPHLWDVTA